ncbi:hypothetical protein ABZW18_00920 [Streptomyces sp. NPDC004647]|uniref:hypothetical protein n=1 Tax=Streptomyces sp. NPDC004647 TaxID=3154671 RepID=UPI0033B22687
MNDGWTWRYDPEQQHVTGRLPAGVVTEVERLVAQLVELADSGVDITDLGNGPRHGGLRRMEAAGGWFHFLVAPRHRLIIIVRIVPPLDEP